MSSRVYVRRVWDDRIERCAWDRCEKDAADLSVGAKAWANYARARKAIQRAERAWTMRLSEKHPTIREQKRWARVAKKAQKEDERRWRSLDRLISKELKKPSSKAPVVCRGPGPT